VRLKKLSVNWAQKCREPEKRAICLTNRRLCLTSLFRQLPRIGQGVDRVRGLSRGWL
jgi:hypothetical protein